MVDMRRSWERFEVDEDSIWRVMDGKSTHTISSLDVDPYLFKYIKQFHSILSLS